MEKACKGLKTRNALFSSLCIVLATASHAFANNAPGPLAFVSLLSLVIVMVVLTYAGGGYGVMRRLDDAKYRSKLKRTIFNTLEFIAGVVLFFVGMFASIFGVAVFSLYAIGRGVRMIKWSKDAGKEGVRPAHLEGVNPQRLRFAGIMLIILSVLIFGYSILNIGEVTGTYDYRKSAYAAALNADVRSAKLAAEQYLVEHPKTAGVITCSDMEKAGYKPSLNVTCFSDLTATSGSIRMTGPESWKLKIPVAVITYSGEFTRAER